MISSSQAGLDLAPGQVGRKRDVLHRGERRYEVERLEDEPDAVAPHPGQLLVAQGAQVEIAEQHATGGQGVEAGQAVHQGRLPRSRRAHHGGEAALFDADVDAVEGPHGCAATLVHLGRADRGRGRGR